MRRVGHETVSQLTAAGQRASLTKERWRMLGPAGANLALVRKLRPDQEPRGQVVLVHGFAQNRYSWHSSGRSMSAWLAAQGWDVWNLELRGHGDSRTGPGAEGIGDYVDDVTAVAKALDAGAFFVGHSLGAAVLYGASPDLGARGVVGLGGIYSFGSTNRTLRATAHLTRLLHQRAGWLAGFDLRTQFVGRLMARAVAWTDPLGFVSPFAGWWPESIEPGILEERLEQGFDWTSARVWVSLSEVAARGVRPWIAPWQRSEVPCLIVAGDEDRLVSPADARGAYEDSRASDKSWVELTLDAHGTSFGHLDMVLGRSAPDVVWPLVHDWMAERAPT